MTGATLEARLDNVKMPPTSKRSPRRAAVPARDPERYHHGDLRAALVAAAEAVLAERGADGFTLRECARRAGVSHAAPAHHFGDARGLLTAVAAHGFERMSAGMARARRVAPTPAEALTGVGQAYVEFAVGHPAQFALMARTGVLDMADGELQRHAHAAFEHLRETLAAANGPGAEADPSFERRMLLAWSALHGLAMLALEGKLGDFAPGAAPRRIAERLAPPMLEQLRIALVGPAAAR